VLKGGGDKASDVKKKEKELELPSPQKNCAERKKDGLWVGKKNRETGLRLDRRVKRKKNGGGKRGEKGTLYTLFSQSK